MIMEFKNRDDQTVCRLCGGKDGHDKVALPLPYPFGCVLRHYDCPLGEKE
jgi:hypothetical protein